MPSFCVKNTLRKDIIRYDIFFNQSEKAVDFLSIECPYFNYKFLPSEGVVKSRIIQNSSKIILDCMKQHFMVFTPNDPSFVKSACAYATPAFNSSSKNVWRRMHHFILISFLMMILEILMMMMKTKKLAELYKFLTLLLLRRLCHSAVVAQNEPLYFVKLTVKRNAAESHSDPYGHFIPAGKKCLRGFYLKLTRSRTFFKYKNEYHRQLELKKYMKKMRLFV